MTRVPEAFRLGGIEVPPGRRKDIRLRISESFTATPVYIPVTVLCGYRAGPAIFIMAALHGNELNGMEAIRRLRSELDPERLSGTLIMVSIANPISFVAQMRDLPDGRDLNRSFPGSAHGSMAAQVARVLFQRIVKPCAYGVDLHTAAIGRTNLPHVRADMRIQGVRRLAEGFGAEVILDTRGERGMLRREATRAGIPTIVFEGGEPMRFEVPLIERAVRGIRNLLVDLGMYPGARHSPRFQIVVEDRRWVRSPRGGILILKVKPGDFVEKGQELGYNMKPYGKEVSVLRAPFSGLVVGVATHPMAFPGTAVCHILKLPPRYSKLRRLFDHLKEDEE